MKIIGYILIVLSLVQLSGVVFGGGSSNAFAGGLFWLGVGVLLLLIHNRNNDKNKAIEPEVVADDKRSWKDLQ